MRNLLAALAAIGLIAAAPAAAPAAAASGSGSAPALWDLDAARQAVETVEAFHAAMRAQDGPAAAALLSADLVVYEAGQAEKTRAEYMEVHFIQDMKFAAGTTRAVTRSTARATGEVAVVMSEGTVKGRFQGREIDAVNLETMVLRREASGWKILHIHWSSRRAETPPT